MLAVVVAVAVIAGMGLFLWQRSQAAQQPAFHDDADVEGQRMIAATQARFRRQMRDQPDLARWSQDDIHAAHILDLDEPAYKAEFDRRGLTL